MKTHMNTDMKTHSENKVAETNGRTSHMHVFYFSSTMLLLQIVDRDTFYELTHNSYVLYISPR